MGLMISCTRPAKEGPSLVARGQSCHWGRTQYPPCNPTANIATSSIGHTAAGQAHSAACFSQDRCHNPQPKSIFQSAAAQMKDALLHSSRSTVDCPRGLRVSGAFYLVEVGGWFGSREDPCAVHSTWILTVHVRYLCVHGVGTNTPLCPGSWGRG
jgi:hypothetical protein